MRHREHRPPPRSCRPKHELSFPTQQRPAPTSAAECAGLAAGAQVLRGDGPPKDLDVQVVSPHRAPRWRPSLSGPGVGDIPARPPRNSAHQLKDEIRRLALAEDRGAPRDVGHGDDAHQPMLRVDDR